MNRIRLFAIMGSLVGLGIAGCGSSSPGRASLLKGCVKMMERHSRHAAGQTAAQPEASHSQAGQEKPALANTRCPIMKGEIDSTKLTDSLVRRYKGKRVAFCCGSCPRTWEKLDDTEKDAKLMAVSGKV